MSGPKHSETFYYDDGSIVLCAFNDDKTASTLYRLYPALLGKRSAMLQTMFKMGTAPRAGAGAPHVEDGYDDAHPISLPHPKFTSSKFDHLLTYIFIGPSDYPTDEQFLLDVLDLSDFLDISDGISYVVQTLEARRTLFSASLKFKLAWKYGIGKWVKPSIQELMELPGSHLTEKDAENLGFDAFYLIVSTKFRVDEVRKGMAYNTPDLVKGASCMRFDKCGAVWESIWWSRLARHILHPDWSTVGTRVREQLEPANIPGICSECQNETLRDMDDQDLFTQDLGLVKRCVEQLMDLCGIVQSTGSP